jgi:hypothetical protein
MKLTQTCGLLCLAAVLLAGLAKADAHQHLVAGADSAATGSALIFVNAGDYATNSGFAFGLDAGAPGSSYDGWYCTGDLIFSALAATSAYGGPEPQAAALGSHIEVVLETIAGPPGASFGFWETDQDGVDSTNLTWTVPVGLASGTNRITVSETDNSPSADPYGHIHGRIYSVNRPGLYTLGFRFIDSSTNGPGGGPMQSPSERFYLYFQADVTIPEIRVAGGEVSLTFAAPANAPEDGTAPATNYQVESATVLDPSANWQPVGDPVVGDDHVHTLAFPQTQVSTFFRLNTFRPAQVPPGK